MRRPRLATLAALGLVAAAFVALVGITLTSAVAYYVTPTELAATTPSGAIRLYGIVEPGSVRWNTASATLTFRVTDGSTTVDVASQALPTGLFRDGIGVVLAGRLATGGVFAASEVLVKHSSVYAPLKPGETPPPDLVESIRKAAP
ncbi:MAG: cytochrome c maturation protein CcmE [Chloroflexi bacterium]|nr:cytochrome c maturation protein CcmE [Chloroflexota bacterium]